MVRAVSVPVACVFAASCFVSASHVFAQSATYAGEPINYMTAEVNDPVAQLADKLAAGEIDLEFDEEKGYLPAILEALDVPVSSQTLVFSKTSLQLSRIAPHKPRAIYFNDDVYVGFCQNGDVLEFAATDAKQGATFYTLDQVKSDKPEFIRDRGLCLSCHASHKTQDVPGYLIRSVYSDRTGRPLLGSGTYVTDHKSDFAKRWGGWYVTGQSGEMSHLGNSLFNRHEPQQASPEAGNRDSLAGLVNTTPYLSDHSDVVALMVMEHQTQMHNALASANYESRRAVHQSFQMNEMLDRPEGFLSESAERRLDKSAERVVSHLFYCDEFQLTDQVIGSSDFAEEFSARGIRDINGRSLRDFNLKTRMFELPCSYLIHSPAFDELPQELAKRVRVRIREILDGRDESGDYEHLTPEIRTALLAHLQETKPELFENVEAVASLERH